MTKQYSTVSTEFYRAVPETPEVCLTLDQKPFSRSSGDILTMDQIAVANNWEWIRVLSGGTAMSSDFDKIVEAYYAQCGKNDDGSISTTVYVFKSPINLPYKLVANSGTFGTSSITEGVSREQSVSFKLDISVSLGHLVDSVQSIVWEGGVYSSDGNKIQEPAPVVSGEYLVATRPVYGTARIKYKVFGDAWDLVLPMREDKSYQSTVMAFYDGKVEVMEVNLPNLSDLCTDSATVCLGDCETEETEETTTTEDTGGVVDPYPGADPPEGDYGDLEVINVPMEPSAGCEALIEIILEPGCPEGTPDLEWDSDLSASIIAPGASAGVYVKHGYPPFEWSIGGGYGYTLQYSETTDRENTLIAAGDACGTAGISIVDMCQTQAAGSVDSSVASDLEWDWDASGETVIASGSVDVFVTGGSPPYTWNISGEDFSIHSESTYGGQNTVYAGPAACGSADITVTDVCDNVTEGHVRCTSNGSWVLLSNDLWGAKGYVPGGGTTCIAGATTATNGKYKASELVQVVCQDYSSCPSAPTCAGASNIYYTPGNWDPEMQLMGVGTPIDCMTYSGIPGCGLTGQVKKGECCESLGSGAISRLGVTGRNAWEWRC